MGQRKKASSEYDTTSTTLSVALFGGACAFITGESFYGGRKGCGLAANGRAPGMAIAYGCSLPGMHCVLWLPGPFGIP